MKSTYYFGITLRVILFSISILGLIVAVKTSDLSCYIGSAICMILIIITSKISTYNYEKYKDKLKNIE